MIAAIITSLETALSGVTKREKEDLCPFGPLLYRKGDYFGEACESCSSKRSKKISISIILYYGLLPVIYISASQSEGF